MTESAASPFRHESSGRPTVVVFDPVPGVARSSFEAVEDLHRLAAEYVLDLLEGGGRISVAA